MELCSKQTLKSDFECRSYASKLTTTTTPLVLLRPITLAGSNGRVLKLLLLAN